MPDQATQDWLEERERADDQLPLDDQEVERERRFVDSYAGAAPRGREAVAFNKREICALYAMRQCGPLHVGRPAPAGALIIVADDQRVWSIDDAGVTTRLS